MRRLSYLLTVLPLLSCAAVAGEASAASEPELTYPLPKARVGFGLTYVLQECPSKNKPPKIETITAISPKYLAGREVSLDPTAGFLTKRTLNLAYHTNGTIKSINASSEGQGAEFVSSAVKAVGFGISLGTRTGIANTESAVDWSEAEAEPSEELNCRAWVATVLDEIAEVQSKLDDPSVPFTDSEERTKRLEKRLADLTRLVSLSAKSVNFVPTTEAKHVGKDGKFLWSETLHSGEIDFNQWFIAVPGKPDVNSQIDNIGLPGTFGYSLTVKGGAVGGSTDPAEKRQVCETGDLSSQRTLYSCDRFRLAAKMTPMKRRATDALIPCNRTLYEDHCVQANIVWKRSKASMNFNAPQLGEIRELRFDGSGIFGSKSIKATFSENGTTTDVGYSDAGGAKAFAGVVDSSVETASTLRDARLNALKRELELKKTESDLLDLIEEEGDAEEVAETP